MQGQCSIYQNLPLGLPNMLLISFCHLFVYPATAQHGTIIAYARRAGTVLTSLFRLFVIDLVFLCLMMLVDQISLLLPSLILLSMTEPDLLPIMRGR